MTFKYLYTQIMSNMWRREMKAFAIEEEIPVAVHMTNYGT